MPCVKSEDEDIRIIAMPQGGFCIVTLATGRIHQGDCVALLDRLEPGSIQLAFADPPFNIGYQYDKYDDRRTSDDYLDWSRKWMAGVVRALADDGTFWLAIGDEYAAELKVIATGELGLAMRSWVVWYYTFGVNCTRKFSRSHAHLFHFVKDPRRFTFNADDTHVRVPSARALVYGDRRANPAGRLPDDTWILRPQDLPAGFQPTDDTWYFARVAGTFKEREGFHGCQMPEQLLGRIIRISSNGAESPESSVQSRECPEPRAQSSEATFPSESLDSQLSTLDSSDLVLDPFAGSGTTLAVAKKLGRRWIGFELSADYVAYATERLEAITPGDPLDGPENPLTSAPSTRNGVRLADRQSPSGRKRSRRPRGSRTAPAGPTLFDE